MIIRRATDADQAFIREMVWEALFVPPGEAPFPSEILDGPEVARYHRAFGTKPGDFGFVAEDGSDAIGAAWVRQLAGVERGYGWVDDETPELTIALVERYQQRGTGSALLARLVGEVGRCSLSVDQRNPAVRLYERSGFVTVERDGDTLTMLRTS